MKSTTTFSVNGFKTCLAFFAGIFCFCLVQAQSPQGIGKPAPLNPPAIAVVQTPVAHVQTEQEKANAAKSMEEYNRLNGSQPAKEVDAVRLPQPNDAVDPKSTSGKE